MGEARLSDKTVERLVKDLVYRLHITLIFIFHDNSKTVLRAYGYSWTVSIPNFIIVKCDS